ncbi:OmpA family protein [Vibrio sp. TH_r3]|uniref:OmpA family protein n=1 Tax=Vibrio sp. TH_r3 TaxID=3082084 RepID=UPI0029542163|nr:OmpA family protein [Vibrio sp. TH_r3]MDV7105846.1 OmpA family protein [Vibrio sp. TH_r3]
MNKSVLLASTLLVLSPQFAQAEPYVGAKLGHSWLEGSCPTDKSCSDDHFAGGVYGGYDFTDMFGFEVGFDYLGDFATEIDKPMKAFTVAPKLMIPVGDLDLFGKIGTARIDYGDVNDTVMLTAVGAEYGFSDNVFGRFEYQRLNNITAGIVDNLNVNSLFLGLTYKFGASEEPTPMIVEEPAPVVAEPVAVVEEPAPQPKLFQEFGVELFDNDSAKLADNSEQYFDWLVSVMKKYPQANVSIIGHTDSVGSEEYNQVLSEKRAGVVADYLYSQGIEESRVTVSGMGEAEPKASNDTAEGRMENRRVEVIVDQFEITE